MSWLFTSPKHHLIEDDNLFVEGKRFRCRLYRARECPPVVLVSQVGADGPKPSLFVKRVANKVWREVVGFSPCGFLLYYDQGEPSRAARRLYRVTFQWLPLGKSPERRTVYRTDESAAQWSEFWAVVGVVPAQAPDDCCNGM